MHVTKNPVTQQMRRKKKPISKYFSMDEGH